MSVFLPKMMVPSLTELTPESLQKRGITFLMMDFDNTIVPYTTDMPTKEMVAWLQKMQASGVRFCVVSNSKKPRVVRFCKKYGLDCITHAKKPFHRGIDECLKQYHLDKKQTALVGDQIYTDVLGANTAGITSILIHAIHNHSIWLKLRHIVELPFIGLGKVRLRFEKL